ncbi:MAG: hypothetical protein RBT55_08155 [Rhodocyclaceae bacterium]|nr:hypothetical protein [Rhodocyclaceae bacterium]
MRLSKAASNGYVPNGESFMDRLDEMIDRAAHNSAWLAEAPRAVSVRVEGARLALELNTGVLVSIPWGQLGLGPTPAARVEILGNGLDVFFPDEDAIVFVPNLLASIAHTRHAA